MYAELSTCFLQKFSNLRWMVQMLWLLYKWPISLMDFNQRAPLNSQDLKSNSLDWCYYISVFFFMWRIWHSIETLSVSWWFPCCSLSVVHFSTNTAKQRTIFFKIIRQSCQFLCACFLLVGKAAVVSVLSLETNLSALLPFVESTGRSLFWWSLYLWK